jgi:hypothetical protein
MLMKNDRSNTAANNSLSSWHFSRTVVLAGLT